MRRTAVITLVIALFALTGWVVLSCAGSVATGSRSLYDEFKYFGASGDRICLQRFAGYGEGALIRACCRHVAGWGGEGAIWSSSRFDACTSMQDEFYKRRWKKQLEEEDEDLEIIKKLTPDAR